MKRIGTYRLWGVMLENRVPMPNYLEGFELG